MNISLLGPLNRDSRLHGILLSSPVPIPFLDGQPLPFQLIQLTGPDELDTTRAIKAFLQLTKTDRAAATSQVFAYFNRVDDAVDGGAGCNVAAHDDIWQHVHPRLIGVVRDRDHARAIHVQVLAECDWEPEHGLQLVFRDGKDLVRVSEQDGNLYD
jgi:uncharacterized protein DUF6985